VAEDKIDLTQVASYRKSFQKDYKELEGYKIALLKDPVSPGLDNLHEGLAKARENKNRVGTMLIEAIGVRNDIAKIMRGKKKVYEIGKAEAYQTQVVQDGRDKSQRDALAELAVEKQLDSWKSWEDITQEAKIHEDILRLVWDDLKEVKSDIIYGVLRIIENQMLIGEVALNPTAEKVLRERLGQRAGSAKTKFIQGIKEGKTDL